MADIKWIKLDTNIISDDKVEQLLGLPNGKRMLLTWILLLCLAGKLNKSGYFLTGDKPYTTKMFTAPLKETEKFLQKTFKIFQEFGMLGQEDGAYYIVNWEKHQSADKLDKIREKDRLKKQRQRAKRKALSLDVPGDVPGDVPPQNKKENEKQKENENENENIYYNIPDQWEQVIFTYCQTLPEEIRQETAGLIQTWLSTLKNRNKLPIPTALAMTLEKLQPMAKESNMTLKVYLKEMICRGWTNFYPIPEYQRPKPKKNTSYDIEEITRLIESEGGGSL